MVISVNTLNKRGNEIHEVGDGARKKTAIRYSYDVTSNRYFSIVENIMFLTHVNVLCFSAAFLLIQTSTRQSVRMFVIIMVGEKLLNVTLRRLSEN